MRESQSRGPSGDDADDEDEDAPVVRDAESLGDVEAGDGTRALDKKVGVLAGLPRAREEVVEPPSEAADRLLHERDGEEVVRDHDCEHDEERQLVKATQERRKGEREGDARCMSSAGSPPTAENSMP